MKLTFGIITLNAGFFIRQVLESIYPFAHKIIIADGAVKWWYENAGISGSIDNTLEAIMSFPDPDNKILLIRGTMPLNLKYPEIKDGIVTHLIDHEVKYFYKEKDDQCRAWFQHVPTDTDYVICNDADEVHGPENLEKLIAFLQKEQPTSVGFKSDSFFGGFDRIIGGFERDHSFKRILKYVSGCFYRTHRQPTLSIFNSAPAANTAQQNFELGYTCTDISGKDITGNQLYEATGITMWHGSYVSPKQVYDKIRYYEGAVIAKGQCIPDYFNQVWLNWVRNPGLRNEIERRWNGVQEFMPSARSECLTIPYAGTHPPAIQAAMPELLERFDNELKLFV